MEIIIEPQNRAQPLPGSNRSGERKRAIEEAGRTPDPSSQWSATELDDAILALCDDVPRPRMVACWHALEHCRRNTSRGTATSLLTEMRLALRMDAEKQRGLATAA
jgi:hypothetical protein